MVQVRPDCKIVIRLELDLTSCQPNLVASLKSVSKAAHWNLTQLFFNISSGIELWRTDDDRLSGFVKSEARYSFGVLKGLSEVA